MSERSKGDTSSSVAAPPSSARIVKNPLLSASVTVLTFDDFQNKPLLLPAAPPIIHAVPVVSCSRESTPLVTVGKSSDIDTENLSEINLNDISGSTTSNAADISDENSNTLLEPSVQADSSILSQAATSFSQLPSVASSVFSTFSKKFNSTTTREDINSNPQLDIQPFGTQATNIQPPPAAFSNPDQQLSNISQNEPQLPIEPPTFYSPTEVPSVPAVLPQPPISSGQNTYRISARKKIYAPIPGLSAAHQEQNFPPANASYLPPIGFETAPVPHYRKEPSNKPEDSKGGFSLSNLVPGVPSVFQNLSGFVQSAAGSLSQKLQELPSQQQLDNNFVEPPSAYYSPQNQNFFGVDPSLQQAYPPPISALVNFYTPSGAGGIQSIPQPAALDQQAVGNFFASIPPKSQSINPGPEVIPSTLLPHRPVGVPFSEQPSQSTSITAPTAPQILPSGNPPPKPSSARPIFTEQLQSNTLTNIPSVTTGPPPVSTSQPLRTGLNFTSAPSQSSSASAANLQSTGSLFVSHTPQSNTPTNIPSVSSGPPSAGVGDVYGKQPLPSQAPPPLKPPGGQPSSSFRLQKGTRLYKSPFPSTTVEYPPQQISGYPPASQSSVPPSQTTTQAFNPFYRQHQGLAPSQETASATILAPASDTDTITVQETNIFSPLNPVQNSFVPFQGPPLVTNSTEVVNSEQQIPSQAPPSILFESQSVEKVSAAPIQPFAPSQEPPFTLYPEKDNLSAKSQEPDFYSGFNPLQLTPAETVVPTKVTELVSEGNSENSSVQEEARPLTTLQILQPVENTSNEPAIVPFYKIPEQEQRQHKLFSSAPLSEEQIKLPSTFNPVNTTQTESRKANENVGTIEQFNISQSVHLPPPPVATSGISATSKETANFPPPPPHAFQNQANSNPYRRGLPSHHTQAPAPAALASFFTPIGQEVNIFNQIATDPLTLTSATTSVAEFFNPAAAPEPSKLPEETTSVDSPIESNLTLQTDIQQKPAVSAIFTPIPATAPTPPLAETLSFETDSIQSAPLSSCFATEIPVESSKLKEDSKSTVAPVAPATNPISFFKPDLPSDSFSAVLTNELPIPQESSKQITAAVPPPAPSSKIASPLESKKKSESQQSVPNLFSNFFEHAAPTAGVTPTISQPSLPDPTSFFDSFGQVPSVGVDVPTPPEDPNSQRIQNFFNNPPPKDLDPVGDLNYNLVGSGLSVKNLQTRSLTPASNLAEPPSSSCSEFSELNSSLSAANRQPRIPADDSNKVSPEEGIIFEAPDNQDLPEEILNEIKMANSALEKNGAIIPANVVYKPAVKHWFYKRKLDTKYVWTPFSHYDSALLESAFMLGDGAPNLIAVEGGRYDVNIMDRTKAPVYWEGEPIEVKRCSWFYKASDSKYVPYEEQVADLLEEEYKKASDNCEWHKKIPISAGDMVVFHGPTVIVHFHQQQQVDSWGGSTLDSESFLSYIQQQTSTRPRVVKRDLDDFVIEEGETHKVDHLLYMVHGIGSACDLKMRSVEEVVDEFRGIALQLVQSHYKNSVENGFVGRVEVLPVSWHGELHSDELGIDEKLKSITLESIPKLRNFTNDTLLDILFYTSPMFCQRIMNTVTASMNGIFMKYKQRNPDFRGGVSLAGHSLGSLILFDLLCHQRPLKECDEENMENPDEINQGYPVDSNKLNEDPGSNISYQMGPAGTGQPFISYPQLLFQPKKFFALGSPIGMFVTIRGIDKLGLNFRLPTCAGFYNIFHPYDPVAYRLEALVNPDMTGIPPVLIPHHKGRKRMHLELKETMSRVGADLKQRFFETFKTTFDSVGFLAPKALKNDSKEMEKEVEKILELQAHQDQQARQGPSTSRSRANSNSTNQSDTEMIEVDFPLGKLNDSKRVDYVLQEAPLEFFNEYLFALSSHVCYWESEDTILFVMKEIYNGLGISTDSQVPQQTMTIERPSSSGSAAQSPTS